MSKDSEWKTGNGGTEYFDDTLKCIVTLDSPEKFLTYMVNQYSNLFDMTKHILNNNSLGNGVKQLCVADIETAQKAVRELIK